MMPAARTRGMRVLSMPKATSASGWALVKISLLTISPALPALMMLSLTLCSASNLASKSLGRLNEPCVSTRRATGSEGAVCADAAAGAASTPASESTEDAMVDATVDAIEDTKKRRCMVATFSKKQRTEGATKKVAATTACTLCITLPTLA